MNRPSSTSRSLVNSLILLLMLALPLFAGGFARAAITGVGGPIDQDTTWAKDEYVVEAPVIVSPGVTLTIQPGSVVKFSGQRVGLLVEGTLSAAGTALEPIYFTSVNDHAAGTATGTGTPQAQDWNSIVFTSSSVNSLMSNVVVSYGGFGDSYYSYDPFYGAVEIYSSSLTFDNCLIQSNYLGAHVDGVAPAIQNCTFNANSTWGLNVVNGGTPTVTGGTFTAQAGWGIQAFYSSRPVVSGVSFSGNGNGAVYVDATSSGIVLDSNTYNGQLTAMDAGSLAADTTWAKGEWVLYGTITVPETVTLTIQPGTLVKLNGQRTGLNVNGTFNATGTTEEPIYFTSFNDQSVGTATGSGNPQPQDWNSIVLNPTSLNNVLINTVIRFGGFGDTSYTWDPYYGALEIYSSSTSIDAATISNNYAGVYVDAAAPTIHGTTISSNSNWGVHVVNGGMPTITASTFSSNGAWGLQAGGASKPTVSTSIFNGNGSGAVYVDATSSGIVLDSNTYMGQKVAIEAGSLAADTTWAKGEWILYGTITVPQGVTLTVQPGTVVKFSGARDGLYVGGTLNAVGTVAEPIYFTSFNDQTVGSATGTGTPAASDWNSIVLGAASLNSVIRNTFIRYGGFGDNYYSWDPWYGALEVYSSSATIDATTVANNHSGVYVDAAAPTLQGCTITSNSGWGVYVTNGATPAITGNTISSNGSWGAQVANGSAPAVTGNTFDGNVGGSVFIDTASSALTMSGNTFTGTGSVAMIQGGAISVNTTWPKGEWVINGTVTVPADVVLTIVPGTVIKFSGQHTGLDVYGTLIADGTVEEPIYFTSINDHSIGSATGNGTPATQDWNSIRLLGGSLNNLIRNAVIRWGGYGNTYYYNDPYNGALEIYSSSTTVEATTIASNLNGIYLSGSAATVSGNTITASTGWGVVVTDASTPVLTSNVISSNGEWGLKLGGSSVAQVTDNVFDSNAPGAIELEPSSYVTTFTGNTFTGTGALCQIPGGTVGTSATWPKGEWVVTGSITVPLGSTLTIEPGAVVKFNGGGFASFEVYGALSAVGTPTEPIFFTSINDNSVGTALGNGTPLMGDWDHIAFLDGSGPSTVKNAKFSYGGYNYWWYGWYSYDRGVVEIFSTSVTIDSSEFAFNDGALYVGNSAAPTLSNLNVHQNNRWGLFGETGSPVVSDSTFTGATWGMQFTASSAPTITNCLVDANTNGIDFATSNGTVDGSTITNNTTLGVQALTDSSPVFGANTISGNGTNVVMDVSSSGSAMGSYLSPENVVILNGGSLTRDTTWGAGFTWVVRGSVNIPAGLTLTVTPGAIVKFSGATDSIEVYGTLLADGTELDPIHFTSLNDHSVGAATGNGTPARSDWDHLAFYEGSGPSVLRNAHITYGGYNYWWYGWYSLDRGAVEVYTGDLVIDSCEVAFNSGGVYVTSMAAVQITASNFHDNTEWGLFADSGAPVISGSTFTANTWGLDFQYSIPTIVDCLIEGNDNGVLFNLASNGTVNGTSIINNTGVGAQIIADSNPVFVTNTITGNANNVALDASTAGVDLGNYFNPATAIHVPGGSITSNVTWKKGLTYVLDGTLSVPVGFTLTIEPGTIIKAGGGWNGLTIYGTLVADGTVAEPIYFTSINDDSVGVALATALPAPQDWNSINFSSTSTGSILRNAKVSYGGFGYYWYGWYDLQNGALELFTSDVTLSNCELTHNYGGLYVGAGVAPVVSDMTITDNQGWGVRVDAGSPVLSRLSVLRNGIGMAVTAAGAPVIEDCDFNENITGVNFDGASAGSISLSRINANTSFGLEITQGSEPLLSQNTISGNDVGVMLRSAATPILLNNGITPNASYDVGMEASSLHVSLDTNALTAAKPVRIEGASLTADATLKKGYNWSFNGGVTVPEGLALTVEPGAVLKFNSGVTLEVAGTIITDGSNAETIYFTSINDNTIGEAIGSGAPVQQDWGSVRLLATSIGSVLKNVEFHYGGYGYWWYGWYDHYRGVVELYTQHATLDGITVSNNYGGIYVSSPVGPIVSNASIVDNGYFGVQVEGGEASFTGCDISRNASWGAMGVSGAILTVTSSTFTGNAGGAVSIDPTSVFVGKASNTYVDNYNHTPTLAATAEQVAKMGKPYAITLQGVDPDAASNFTYTSEGLPAGATLDPATGEFAWTPDLTQEGSYSIPITVTDGGNPALASSGASFNVRVAYFKNRPPVLSDPGWQYLTPGTTASCRVTATDPDFDAVALEAKGLPSGASFNPSNGVLSWTPTDAQAHVQGGVYPVRINAMDNGVPPLGTSRLVYMTVTEGNHAPIFAPHAPLNVTLGGTVSFVPDVTDPDGNALTFAATGRPSGSTFDPATGRFTWTPRDDQLDFNGGVYTFRIYVYDDGSPSRTATALYTVVVGSGNRAPSIDVPGPLDAVAGVPFSFTVGTTDPEGDAVVLSVSGLPKGATFNPDTGVFSWTPTDAQLALNGSSYKVRFVATDNGVPARTSSRLVTISLSMGNIPPVLAPIGPKKLLSGATLSFAVTATDPDGNGVTLSTSTLPEGASFDAATGRFTWKPTFLQLALNGLTYKVRFTATDDASIQKSTSELVTITVGSEPGAGNIWTEPVSGMDFVWVPAGTFPMGYTFGQGTPGDNPAHGVTITKGFWLGRTEVTQEQYEEFMGSNPSAFTGAPGLPVDSVLWQEADDFTTLFSIAAGRTARLPTEAEWEYAASYSVNGKHWFSGTSGIGAVGDYGWHVDNADGQTQPVGLKLPNPLNLRDMSGNVQEWCSDWYWDYPTGPVADPKGPVDGQFHVVRGGHWNQLPLVLTTEERGWLGYDAPRNNTVGFRIVLEEPGQQVNSFYMDSSSDFALQGNATWVGAPGSEYLSLTSGGAYQSGGVTYTHGLSLAAGFSTSMTFRMAANGADGIYLVIYSELPSEVNPNGVAPFVLDMDTYQNAWDPNANHLDVNGYVGPDPLFSQVLADMPVTLNDGDAHVLNLDYSSQTLTISVDGVPVLSSPFDLGTYLPTGIGYFKVGGRSYDVAQTHEIINWSGTYGTPGL